MRKRIALTVLFLILLAVAYNFFWRSIYPADFDKNEEAYRRLVKLTLVCCAGDDYMADIEDASAEMQTLMRQLGLDRIHYYPGNDQHPGAVVYLERNLAGPIRTMYAYGLNGEPKSITSCYTSSHMKGNWYRSHNLFCLP